MSKDKKKTASSLNKKSPSDYQSSKTSGPKIDIESVFKKKK
ncbi:hypothetical protein [Hufsiella arboris]|nr:hypothetical protein [Hufsiella arboris]